ncbi:hypothetical protein RSAG8_00179, partial [Rhizoctonia solani AG-8 WAC10335]
MANLDPWWIRCIRSTRSSTHMIGSSPAEQRARWLLPSIKLSLQPVVCLTVPGQQPEAGV